MKLDPNDPKLTAYALGELDESERPAIEEALRDDEACRKAVEEIQQVAGLLTEELKGEARPGLLAQQRAAIEAELNKRSAKSGAFPRLRAIPFWLRTALAACVVAAIGAAILLPNLQEKRESDLFPCVIQKVNRVRGNYGQAPTEAPAEEKGEEGSDLRYEPIAVTVRDGGTERQVKPRVRWIDSDSANNAETTMLPEMPAEGIVISGIAGPTPAGPDRSEVLSVEVSTNGGIAHAKPGRAERLDASSVKLSPPGLTPTDFAPFEEKRYGPSMSDYGHIVENEFRRVADEPLSTFSIDVDTAAYAIVRRDLTRGRMPPKDAVRIEELINYFSYNYEPPEGDVPFSVHVEVAQCPWKTEHRLARVGLKGKEISEDERAPSNLVFLLDVSGSMQQPNKLPLLKRAMTELVERLMPKDRVAIAVYAGASGLVLPSTQCTSEGKATILAALNNLRAGGSTNGGAGIQLAYATAAGNFIKGGTNRVILATDGDFNVGVTNRGDLVRLIEDKAKSGVFLTVLGFGMGNYKDSTLEQLADKGNGNYAYIDNDAEARKVFGHQLAGTLVTIAKDVKIQIEFNPGQVAAYRLVGYENRILRKEDFNDDKKDAGEIGAGHTVTALYELVPAGTKLERPAVDPLKYQDKTKLTEAAHSDETMTVKLRYKQPDGDTSKLLERPVKDRGAGYAAASEDYKFAASVAAFGMLLRDSKFKANATYDAILELADEAKGKDPNGYRAEFLRLVRMAKSIAGK